MKLSAVNKFSSVSVCHGTTETPESHSESHSVYRVPQRSPTIMRLNDQARVDDDYKVASWHEGAFKGMEVGVIGVCLCGLLFLRAAARLEHRKKLPSKTLNDSPCDYCAWSLRLNVVCVCVCFSFYSFPLFLRCLSTPSARERQCQRERERRHTQNSNNCNRSLRRTAQSHKMPLPFVHIQRDIYRTTYVRTD